jgi:hypothetical protein
MSKRGLVRLAFVAAVGLCLGLPGAVWAECARGG